MTFSQMFTFCCTSVSFSCFHVAASPSAHSCIKELRKVRRLRANSTGYSKILFIVALHVVRYTLDDVTKDLLTTDH